MSINTDIWNLKSIFTTDHLYLVYKNRTKKKIRRFVAKQTHTHTHLHESKENKNDIINRSDIGLLTKIG